MKEYYDAVVVSVVYANSKKCALGGGLLAIFSKSPDVSDP